MKIPLKNQNLEIRLSITLFPNLKKLKEELTNFFAKNEVEGYKIKKFRIEAAFRDIDYRIVPIEPNLEECLSSKGSCEKELEKIGEKYGIRNFGFIYFCYHK